MMDFATFFSDWISSWLPLSRAWTEEVDDGEVEKAAAICEMLLAITRIHAARIIVVRIILVVDLLVV
jgi:hypothetical protein